MVPDLLGQWILEEKNVDYSGFLIQWRVSTGKPNRGKLTTGKLNAVKI